jgi:predicted transcriptional regulator
MDNQAKEELLYLAKAELFEIYYLPLIQSDYLFSKRRPASKENINSWKQAFMEKDFSTAYRETKTTLVKKLIELDMVRRKMYSGIYSGNVKFTKDEKKRYFDKLMKMKIEDLVDKMQGISRQIDQNYNYSSGEEGDR